MDGHVDLFGLWQHGDGRRRGVNTALGLGVGHSLHPVNASFASQEAERLGATGRENRFFYPARRPRH